MKTSKIPEHTLSRITHLRIMGLSFPQIAKQMETERWPTVNGGSWYPNTVRQYCHQAARRLKGPTATRPTARSGSYPAATPPVLTENVTVRKVG